MDNQFFKNIEKKTGVNMQDVMNLVAPFKTLILKMKTQFGASSSA